MPGAGPCGPAPARPHRSPRPRRDAGISSRCERIIDSGRTPAEEMLEKFNGAWNGSVEPAYAGIRVLVHRVRPFELTQAILHAEFDPFIRRTGWWRSNGRPRKAAERRNALESNSRWGRPPAQGVSGDVSPCSLRAVRRRARPALAQTNFDRPGGDYHSSPVTSGDPADCALVCERDRRCRAWSFNYPTDIDERRGVLAEEHRAGARAGQLLRLRRARRRRGRAAQRRGRNLDRPLRRRLQAISTSRAAKATTPARPPAPPTTNAAPGPMRGRAMPARKRTAS